MVLKRKIAFIDLGKTSVEMASVPVDLRKKFLGGRGKATSLQFCSGKPQCVKMCTPATIRLVDSCLL